MADAMDKGDFYSLSDMTSDRNQSYLSFPTTMKGIDWAPRERNYYT
jgi:hypothetical protein